jgi:hypothetical protein
MAATYQLEKILHYVQDDKGLIYPILILLNTSGDNSSKGIKSPLHNGFFFFYFSDFPDFTDFPNSIPYLCYKFFTLFQQ